MVLCKAVIFLKAPVPSGCTFTEVESKLKASILMRRICSCCNRWSEGHSDVTEPPRQRTWSPATLVKWIFVFPIRQDERQELLRLGAACLYAEVDLRASTKYSQRWIQHRGLEFWYRISQVPPACFWKQRRFGISISSCCP